VGVGQGTIEIPRRSGVVSAGAVGETPLEVVGASRLIYRVVETLLVDLSFFARADRRAACRRSNFDRTAEDTDAISSAAVVIDRVDRAFGSGVAGAVRVEAKHLARVLGSLHGDVAVAQLDDCLRRVAVIGVKNGADADRGRSVEGEHIAIRQTNLGATSPARDLLVARIDR